MPGPQTQNFIFGNALQFRKRLMADGAWAPYWLDMVREHGKIFRLWMVMKPLVFVADPVVLKEMVTDFKKFPKIREARGFISRRTIGFNAQRMYTQRFCGYNSIFTVGMGPIWKRKKKIMDPAFGIQPLTKHLCKFYDIAVSLCDAVEAAQQECPGGPVDVTDVVAPFTVDAISKAGFSADSNQMSKLRRQGEDAKGSEANKKILAKAGRVLLMVLDPDTRKILVNYAESIKKIRKIGAQMIIDRTSNGEFGRVGDILDGIISANMDEDSGKFELEESLDDFMAMYVAGNSTTSTTLLWCIGELARNPDVMDKLVDEIDGVWAGAHVDSHTDPSFIGDTLKQMPYLDAFLKEVLRVHPAVTHIKRRASRDVEIFGYKIPSQTCVMSSQWVMQHLEQYWPDPERFQPERFLTSTPTPYTYLPFFLGPRQCIGKNFAILQLKCYICELLGRFEIEIDPKAPLKQRSGQKLVCFPIDNSFTFKLRF